MEISLSPDKVGKELVKQFNTVIDKRIGRIAFLRKPVYEISHIGPEMQLIESYGKSRHWISQSNYEKAARRINEKQKNGYAGTRDIKSKSISTYQVQLIFRFWIHTGIIDTGRSPHKLLTNDFFSSAKQVWDKVRFGE